MARQILRYFNLPSAVHIGRCCTYDALIDGQFSSDNRIIFDLFGKLNGNVNRRGRQIDRPIVKIDGQFDLGVLFVKVIKNRQYLRFTESNRRINPQFAFRDLA